MVYTSITCIIEKTLPIMPSKIYTAYTIPDARAAVKKKYIKNLAPEFKLQTLFIADAYTIDYSLSKSSLKKIAGAITNSASEKYFIEASPSPEQFDWVIEIGYLPGVTDNIGSTARETIESLLAIKFDGQGVYSSQVLFLSGSLSSSQVETIASNLFNPLIQRVHIKSVTSFKKENGLPIIVPRVKLPKQATTRLVSLNVADGELEKIGKLGIKDRNGNRLGPLALDLDSMKVIQDHFNKKKRPPTDIELESLAQTWSEHCKHTIFADPLDEIKEGLFKTYIKGATEEIRRQKGGKDFCVSVFSDNSGAIIFDEEYLITDKVETHNSPSALDPFGGAITGIVGVNRDTLGFGLGAKPIINKYGYCFAAPWDTEPLYRDNQKKQPMLSPKRILEGVVEGVRAGGNHSGIPTPQGFMFFDSRFKGKPLVFVGTVGLIPRRILNRFGHEKKARPGDYIVMAGGRVGQDGIHGATFSSESLNAASPASAVQIGDPITQKKLSDTIAKEARDQGLINSITDNGAGGLSSSIGEMAKESGGCIVNLEKVPLKYPGLEPWQIWISESQERMTLAVSKKNWKKLSDLFKRRGVEATVIGEFNANGKCQVFMGKKKIMDMAMDFLHDGRPIKKQHSLPTQKRFAEPKLKQETNFNSLILKMLQRTNLSSFMFISQQYDHEVQAGSVLKPLQGKGLVNADASVTRPVPTSKKGVVLSQGINPHYSDIDTYHMAGAVIDTAIRNAVCAGADINHLALLDNFCWSSSDSPERLYELKRAVQACYDYAVAYGTPFISGKDSMFNDFKGYDSKDNFVKISVPPTLLISAIGIIADATKAISIDLKFPGDSIYLIGETFDELGGSEYFHLLSEENGNNAIGNSVPKVDAKKNKLIYSALSKAISQELITSAISVHLGGLASALLRTALAGMLGINVSLDNILGNVRDNHSLLFSESQGRVVVSISPKNEKEFIKLFKETPLKKIGEVSSSNRIKIAGQNNGPLINLKTTDALTAYRKTFKDY